MRRALAIAVFAVALIGGPSDRAAAQTDALVVDEQGEVGVGTAFMGPAEVLDVYATLAPAFSKVPSRCRDGVPVRIVVLDAESGATLLEEQATLGAEQRGLRASLGPLGEEAAPVQIGVLSTKRYRRCVRWGGRVAGPGGVRPVPR